MPTPSLNVSCNDLPATRVAFLQLETDQAAGNFDLAIRNTFDRVKAWVSARGGDVTAVPAIGIAHVTEGRLHAYECCIPMAETLPVGAQDEVGVRTLPGGKYAVVQIEKQSAIIGETIGRFFQEYVPAARLQIDDARPTLEVYWDTTMDFCVPINPGGEGCVD